MLFALVILVGVRRLMFVRALHEAERSRAAIALRYGKGCVAVLRGEAYPEPVACRIEGVRVDSILRQEADGNEVFLLYALALDAGTAERTRYVVDSFDCDGRGIASSAPIAPFRHFPHFGEPAWRGQPAPPGSTLPMIVALRTARPEE